MIPKFDLDGPVFSKTGAETYYQELMLYLLMLYKHKYVVHISVPILKVYLFFIDYVRGEF